MAKGHSELEPPQLPTEKRQTIPVNPSQTYDIWDELYSACRLDKPYPIIVEEALEVVRIIDEVKRGTKFA